MCELGIASLDSMIRRRRRESENDAVLIRDAER